MFHVKHLRASLDTVRRRDGCTTRQSSAFNRDLTAAGERGESQDAALVVSARSVVPAARRRQGTTPEEGGRFIAKLCPRRFRSVIPFRRTRYPHGSPWVRAHR